MNLSTSNEARLDPAVRAELKKQQQARLAVKARVAAGEIEAEEYSAMFAAQPEQKRKAAINAAREAAAAAEQAKRIEEATADAKGGAAAFGGEA